MGLKLSNNAVSRLAANLSNAATSLSVVPGDGALFPTLVVGDWFPATIVKSTGELEIIKVTARSVDVFTIERSQESTLAQSFNAGDRIELRITAGAFGQLQATADTAKAATDVHEGRLDQHDLDIAALQSIVLPPGFGPVPWSRTNLPAGGWIWADGSVLLSSTTYTALRQAYIDDGFPHGQDGSGNPKVPDMRGAVPGGLDNMGGTAAGRLSGATTLGALLGAESVTLTAAQIPAHSHPVYLNDPGHTHGHNAQNTNAQGSSGTGGATIFSLYGGATINSASTGITVRDAAGGGGTANKTANNTGGGGAHSVVQPTRILGFIVKT